MGMTSYSSSDGTLLKFPDPSLLAEHKAEIARVELQTYKKIRAKYGIWASNQDKFVASINDLNEWDSRVMENRLAAE